MALENLPVTPEEVCSRAMVLCGLEPLSSFNETDRDEVVVAATLYEVIVAACLSAYPWRFASGEMELEPAADDPLDRYENAWHYPTLDAGRPLQIESVYTGDRPVTYDIVKNLIYASEPETAALVAHYQYRVEEAYWLPQFTLYVIFTLAQTFAQSVTRNAKQMADFRNSAEVQFMRAKTRDSQSKSPRRARMTALRRRRFGVRGDPDAA
jgi:hypothetical protein